MNRYSPVFALSAACALLLAHSASAQGVGAPVGGGSGSTTQPAPSQQGTTPATAALGTGTSLAPLAPGAMPSTATPANVASDYRLGVDDTINIGVSRHGDVSGTYRIAPDGLIRLPRLLTPLDARDKTPTELADEISKALVSEGRLVIRPGQVTVYVVSTRVRRIFVRGNAVHGSDFDLKNGWRVDDLVALMGALPQPDRLKATLTNPARASVVPINLDEALKNPKSPDNVALTEGDTLTIDQPGVKRLMIKGEGPKGLHDVDERFGLRQALISLGFSVTGATGDLHAARIIRYETPGDATTPSTIIPVDLLKLLNDDATPETPFHDLDTLDIPISDQFIYILGEIAGPRKWYLPQDRKTYLIDVYSNAGDVTPNAKMGSIQVTRVHDGKYEHESYDLGKYVRNGDPKNNPQIFPHDMIYVPTNSHIDPVNTLFTGFSIYSILKVLSPNL